MVTETDEDLLVMMTWRDTDPEEAREAWAEFYNRHIGYIYAVCERVCQGLLSPDAIKDTAVDTFVKLYEGAAARYEPGDALSPDDGRRRVLGWLGVVAENVTRDRLRGRRDGTASKNIDWECWKSVEELPSVVESKDTAVVRAAMQEVLTDRECHVLRVYFQYFDPDNPSARLPSDILQELAEQLNTTHVNLRKIKERAINKLKQKLSLDT